MTAVRNPTRAVAIGALTVGAGHPIAVQSMCATKTTDVAATVAQVRRLAQAGATIVRVAVDNARDAAALPGIRADTDAALVVDLQENYRLAERAAPHVDKLRYNPGHLYHHERDKPWADKVRYLADVASDHDCALRVGVNAGSVDPARAGSHATDDLLAPMLESAFEHCALLDALGFTRYVVSLKDSDPRHVIELNRRFAAQRPDVPLHLGVTEAGLPPGGILKTRLAFEALLAEGIGDTIRVSLTLPNSRKHEEVEVGHAILADVAAGKPRTAFDVGAGLNIVSCPSCARVQNDAFVDLAEQVRDLTAYARDHRLTIAVMGCRVNGPGETDDADLGLWCGPRHVNLKRGPRLLGSYRYDEILGKLQEALDGLIAERAPAPASTPHHGATPNP